MSIRASDLAVVTVETHLGAVYVFPDMPREALRNVVDSDGWAQAGRLVLVNISAAVLTMEARLVKAVSYDGKVQWPCSPA